MLWRLLFIWWIVRDLNSAPHSLPHGALLCVETITTRTTTYRFMCKHGYMYLQIAPEWVPPSSGAMTSTSYTFVTPTQVLYVLFGSSHTATHPSDQQVLRTQGTLIRSPPQRDSRGSHPNQREPVFRIYRISELVGNPDKLPSTATNDPVAVLQHGQALQIEPIIGDVKHEKARIAIVAA
jgi:hypothetical protein